MISSLVIVESISRCMLGLTESAIGGSTTSHSYGSLRLVVSLSTNCCKYVPLLSLDLFFADLASGLSAANGIL